MKTNYFVHVSCLTTVEDTSGLKSPFGQWLEESPQCKMGFVVFCIFLASIILF